MGLFNRDSDKVRTQNLVIGRQRDRLDFLEEANAEYAKIVTGLRQSNVEMDSMTTKFSEELDKITREISDCKTAHQNTLGELRRKNLVILRKDKQLEYQNGIISGQDKKLEAIEGIL